MLKSTSTTDLEHHHARRRQQHSIQPITLHVTMNGHVQMSSLHPSSVLESLGLDTKSVNPRLLYSNNANDSGFALAEVKHDSRDVVTAVCPTTGTDLAKVELVSICAVTQTLRKPRQAISVASAKITLTLSDLSDLSRPLPMLLRMSLATRTTRTSILETYRHRKDVQFCLPSEVFWRSTRTSSARLSRSRWARLSLRVEARSRKVNFGGPQMVSVC